MIPLEERKSMIERDDTAVLPVSRQCFLLSVCRSGHYYKSCAESFENMSILRFLDEQYLQTPFYGVERLWALLQRNGYRINRKRLRRLMRLIGWQTLYPERKTTIASAKAHKYPYLLGKLTITGSNQVWAIDITYLSCSGVLCTCLPSLTSFRVMWWAGQ